MRAWLAQPVSWGMWVVSLIAVGLMFGLASWFVATAAIDAQDAKTTAARQVEGRRVAVDVLCGFGNGVATAGRNVIQGLHANGTPIKGVHFTKKERTVRKAAADDYGTFIVQTVQAQAGVKGRDVVKPDGTLDCARFRTTAKANHP